MAVRRCVFALAQLPDRIEDNWLQVSKSMRRQGQFDAARFSLRNAEQHGLSTDDSLLHECRILKDSGQIYKALTMLEPVELDLDSVRGAVKDFNSTLSSTSSKTKKDAAGGASSVALPAYLATAEKRSALRKSYCLRHS